VSHIYYKVQITNHCKFKHLHRAYRGEGKGKVMCICQEDPGPAQAQQCDKRLERTTKSTIPWCLAHTASRNGNWSGALGRLHAKKLFPTIVTTMAPMKVNGRIIHPTEDRFISAREVARAQTFPDTFQFDADCRIALKQVNTPKYFKTTTYCK
jgi:site-specific DNA-cytosine methylase